MARKLQECDVLLPHVIEHADVADVFARQPQNLAPRTAELALHRLDAHRGRAKMLFEKLLENVNQWGTRAIQDSLGIIKLARAPHPRRRPGARVGIRRKNLAAYAARFSSVRKTSFAPVRSSTLRALSAKRTSEQCTETRIPPFFTSAS